MAITLEIRVCHLLPELLTNALIFLCPLQAAGAIAAGALQAVPDGLHHFLIFIQTNSHSDLPFPGFLYDKTPYPVGYGVGGVRGI